MTTVILSDVGPMAPAVASLAGTFWLQAVSGGLSSCPLIIALWDRFAREGPAPSPGGKAARAAHVCAVVLTAATFALALTWLRRPEQLDLGSLNFVSPLVWAVLTGLALPVCHCVCLLPLPRRLAWLAVGLTALAGLAFGLSPAALLQAGPSRYLFQDRAALLGQAVVVGLAACVFLLAVPGGRPRLAEQARGALCALLTLALVSSLWDSTPGNDLDSALLEKARRALVEPGLRVSFLGFGILAGTLVPLLASFYARLALAGAVLGLAGRLAVGHASLHAGLSMLGS